MRKINWFKYYFGHCLQTGWREMWNNFKMLTVATSTSIETGTRPHHGFAKMLYDYLIDRKLPVGLYES